MSLERLPFRMTAHILTLVNGFGSEAINMVAPRLIYQSFSLSHYQLVYAIKPKVYIRWHPLSQLIDMNACVGLIIDRMRIFVPFLNSRSCGPISSGLVMDRRVPCRPHQTVVELSRLVADATTTTATAGMASLRTFPSHVIVNRCLGEKEKLIS